MPLRISPRDFLPGPYTIRYVEEYEGIFKTGGWKKSLHKYWGLDTWPTRGMVRVKGQVYRRDRTSVALYAPGTAYEENLEVGSLVTWSWVLIEEKVSPSILRRLTGKDGFCFLNDPSQSIRKQIRQFAKTTEKGGIERRFLMTGQLHHLIGTLFSLQRAPEQLENKTSAGYSGVHPWRKAVWAALEDSARGSLPTRDLAEALGVSTSVLTHRYREYCGESLHETIDAWRLEKACALLAASTLSIKQVAAKVGFSHQSYLSIFFKNSLGQTPSSYRRMSQETP